MSIVRRPASPLPTTAALPLPLPLLRLPSPPSRPAGVFSGCGRPLTGGTTAGASGSSGGPLMSYEDFIVFYMSEEDKTSEQSLRYWFAICDVDGDGVLTPGGA